MQRIGAVIVTYNNASMLRSLLGDILSQTRRPDEIIVIDNASRDSTRSVADEFSHDVRYVLLPENIGSAGGYCEGIGLAVENNDLVWTLDDDVSAGKNALESLEKWLDILSKNNRVGAVRSWPTEVAPFEAPKQIDSFAWRGTLIKKSAIDAIGLPTKEYFLYGEDVDYSFRIADAGYAMFWVPESRVIENRKVNMAYLELWGIKTTVYKDGFRLYYGFRNQIHLYLRHKKYGHLFRTLGYSVKVVLLLLFVEQRADIKAVFHGMLDGFRSKLGKNREYLP